MGLILHLAIAIPAKTVLSLQMACAILDGGLAYFVRGDLFI
jgi:hypothetical protein